MRIAELSVRRPVFATVVSMLLVIFGIVSLQRLSVREYPDIDRPVVSITTAYRGASAAIIETKITQIIEDSIAGPEDLAHPAGTDALLEHIAVADHIPDAQAHHNSVCRSPRAPFCPTADAVDASRAGATHQEGVARGRSER